MIFAIRLTSIASIGRARAGKSGGLLDLGLGDILIVGANTTAPITLTVVV